MPFQWLDMRIGEEHDRRRREESIRRRLPEGLTELHTYLASCVAEYTKAFGANAAEIEFQNERVHITVREEQPGRWEQQAKVEITVDLSMPGFRVERALGPLMIEVGLLPGDKLFYRDGEEFLTMEELTRRILDQAFFPKLAE